MKNRKRGNIFLDPVLLSCAVAIVLGSFLVSRYFYQLMLIRGDSMSPSYHNMQLTVLNKYDRKFDYGDVIAFRCEGIEEILVKRIVAIPGDTVLISDKKLFVNGKVSPCYPDDAVFSYSGIAAEEIFLSDGQYFVIGDNFELSKDSRYEMIGAVKKEDIIGKALWNKNRRESY